MRNQEYVPFSDEEIERLQKQGEIESNSGFFKYLNATMENKEPETFEEEMTHMRWENSIERKTLQKKMQKVVAVYFIVILGCLGLTEFPNIVHTLWIYAVVAVDLLFFVVFGARNLVEQADLANKFDRGEI